PPAYCNASKKCAIDKQPATARRPDSTSKRHSACPSRHPEDASGESLLAFAASTSRLRNLLCGGKKQQKNRRGYDRPLTTSYSGRGHRPTAPRATCATLRWWISPCP